MSSRGEKLGALLFSGIFALAFGLGGLWGGILPLVETFGMAWSVRSWVPVQAQVLSVDLRSSRGGKGGTTYELTASYEYRLQGQVYRAQRIGLDTPGRSDNIGDWHHRWHRSLSEAQAQGRSVQAWADPLEPSRAVIDRNVRWPMALFHVPFAFVFTAVGIGAGWIFAAVLLDRPMPAVPGAQGHFARTRSGKAMEPTTRAGAWFFAAVWNLLVQPMTLIAWMTGAPLLARIFVTGFAVVGLGLIWSAFQRKT